MHHINKIVYINLDSRTDRRSAIEQEFVRVGIQAERFSALNYKDYPNAGCLLSHATVLEQAYDEGCENVLVLEDDFKFIDDINEVHNSITDFFKLQLEWDVVMLTTCAAVISERTNETVSKIISSGNGAGYLVNRSIMLEMSMLFKANVENLYQTKRHWEYQNDILWKQLMPISNWYMFNEYLGYQREGYSDLSQDNKIAIIPHTQQPDSTILQADSTILPANLNLYIYMIEKEIEKHKSYINPNTDVKPIEFDMPKVNDTIEPYNTTFIPNLIKTQKVDNVANISSKNGKGCPISVLPPTESIQKPVTQKPVTQKPVTQKQESYSEDSIVNKVIASFVERSNIGLKKYGTTLDRNDLSVLDWIQHAQEEHMDAILYLEKLKTYYANK